MRWLSSEVDRRVSSGCIGNICMGTSKARRIRVGPRCICVAIPDGCIYICRGLLILVTRCKLSVLGSYSTAYGNGGGGVIAY